MTAFTIVLVVIMTVNGEDYERRTPMMDIDGCYAEAVVTMKKLKDAETEHGKITMIGIGCVLEEKGDPA